MTSYHRPARLSEALEIRAAREVTVLAGGTDVYPARTARMGWGDMRRPEILDVSAIAELKGIEASGAVLRFGALTTWSELRRAALPAAFAGWQAAAREVGGAQIQNRGTIAGNLCTASPAGDGIPCLLALDAEVELASCAGRRRLPVAAFVDGYRHTALGAGEIVTAVLVPRPDPRAVGRFLKLGARRYLVISIAMAAAVVAVDEAGVISSARIAVGGCSPVAARLPDLESALAGVPAALAAEAVRGSHFDALAPIDDIRASAAYRRAAALALVRDLLSLAAERRAA